jgi:hypothetical protein
MKTEFLSETLVMKSLARRERRRGNYGNSFFERQGDGIQQFKDKAGYIHRLDNNTQEYGILTPENKIQSVFKIQPNERTTYTDGKSYMQEQMNKYGVQN